MFIPIPILIIALVVILLIFLGSVSKKKTNPNSRDALAGTMTVSQAYQISSRYGNAVHEMCEAQTKAANEGDFELVRQIQVDAYLADTFSQVKAALMLTLAQEVLSAGGDREKFEKSQLPRAILLVTTADYSFDEARIPDGFVDACFSLYHEAFASCNADDFEKLTMRGNEARRRYWERIYSKVPLAYTFMSDDYHEVVLKRIDEFLLKH